MDKSKPIEFSKDGKEWREITDVNFNGSFIRINNKFYTYNCLGRVWDSDQTFGYIRNKRSYKQGRCHTCKHFVDTDPTSRTGECHNNKLNSCAGCAEDELFAKEYDYEEYVVVGIEFGCIHWEKGDEI